MEEIQVISISKSIIRLKCKRDQLQTIELIIQDSMTKTDTQGGLCDYVSYFENQNQRCWYRSLDISNYGPNAGKFRTIEDNPLPDADASAFRPTPFDCEDKARISITIIEYLYDDTFNIFFHNGRYRFQSEAWFEVVKQFENMQAASEIFPK
jgi:hypothetical protein